MRYSLALVLVPMLSGCSLIYNESNIPPATPDAFEPDAEVVFDADPTMLKLTGVTPAEIKEGQGAGGSRKALLVIDGEHMVKANLMVMITASAPLTKTPLLMVDTAGIDVDSNGRRLAVPVTLPVDDRGGSVGLNAGDSVALDITVIQTVPGGPTLTRVLPAAVMLRGLDERRGVAPTAGFPAFSEFSEVNLTSGTVKGTTNLAMPIVITATASITIAAAVTVDLSAVGMTGGPAGGNGGMGGAGGLAGGNSGAPGTGPAPGGASAGGRYEGDEQLTSLDGKNRSSGGGGGDGAGVLNGSAGGNGGGGGGSIEISAGGDVMVGNVTANGAAGTVTNASTGGGGSGGVVLVRAGGALTAGTISVVGMGNGQPGRGRYDGKTATVANPSALFRGPMMVDAPLVTNAEKPTVTVSGQPQKNFQYFFSSANGVDESSLFADSFPGSGSKTLTLAGSLYPGLNKLCLVVAGGDKTSATRNCIDIAHLYKPPM